VAHSDRLTGSGAKRGAQEERKRGREVEVEPRRRAELRVAEKRKKVEE